MPINTDPDWLVRARAEGRVISDTGYRPSGSLPVEDYVANMVPKSASGSSTKPRGNKQELIATSRLAFIVTISGLRLVSEANAGGKLRDKIKRKSAVRETVWLALSRRPRMTAWPFVITLTRLGGKRLDSDNLARSMKAVQDAVAEWLGIDDGDERIEWKYEARPDWVMGCEIKIEEAKR